MKKRIEYIDLAKGFCICLVVLFHMSMFYEVTLPGNAFMKSFRMPLYFFLSGCFFKTYGGLLDFVKRKVNKLLIPFVFFYIVCSFAIPNFVAVVLHANMRYLPFSQLPTAWLGEIYPAGAIWFLLCLFEINLLFYLMFLVTRHSSHQNVLLSVLSLAIGMTGISLGMNGINLPANVDSALSALPFFVMGYMTFRHTPLLQPNSLDRYLPLTIAASLALTWLLAPDFSFLDNAFYDNAWLWVYPCGALGVYGVVMLAKLLQRLPLFSYYGRYSIMILVTHDTVFHLFGSVLQRVVSDTELQFVCNFVITLLAYLLIIPFMRRFMPHVTAQKDVIRVN